jgi:hypothetical protein
MYRLNLYLSMWNDLKGPSDWLRLTLGSNCISLWLGDLQYKQKLPSFEFEYTESSTYSNTINYILSSGP